VHLDAVSTFLALRLGDVCGCLGGGARGDKEGEQPAGHEGIKFRDELTLRAQLEDDVCGCGSFPAAGRKK
jgi:hypothetical protein